MAHITNDKQTDIVTFRLNWLVESKYEEEENLDTVALLVTKPTSAKFISFQIPLLSPSH